MNITRFLENRFQELKWEEGNTDAFNVRIDSEMKATHQVLTLYRKLVMWFMIPKVLWDFCLVKLGFKEEPQPILLNKLKEQKQAEEVAKKMMQEANVTPLQPKGESPVPAG